MQDPEHGAAQRRVNSQGLRPLIIPPSLEKSSFFTHPLIKVIWSRAREAIERASSIYVVGYSLPESDTYVDLLFARSLRRLPEVFMLDINPGIVERAQRYFQKDARVRDGFIGPDAVDRLVEHLRQ